MRIVVADASSLILLAKVDALALYGRRVHLLVPRTVVEECAAPDLAARHPDAAVIRGFLEGGLLEVRETIGTRPLPIALGRGEADALHVFFESGADLLLSDDGRALRACRLLGVPFTSSPRVLVDLCAAGALSRADARRALEFLGTAGRYPTAVIAAALSMLSEVPS